MQDMFAWDFAVDLARLPDWMAPDLAETLRTDALLQAMLVRPVAGPIR